ncbi:chorismate lyase [Pseudomonas sp. gcc21]|uniref:chorismate--pyruvate lyase family protein n=1 Tax=Pseudomonas sp. gcc21 TaxID=2726989 RepID=UPI001451EBED|nr:chorismate lyase [Pseudomonas sp. gcc21]QJD59670.1 chorismate lyase [Pseudomonas sp. gcc21]
MRLPDWHFAARHPSKPAGLLLDWLQNEESLTQRLTEAGDNDFRVELLQQTQQPARTDEACSLDLEPGTQVWVREVLLHTAGAPRVFARSVAPLHTLAEAKADLTNLGSRSLGELLFRGDLDISRGPIEISLYPAEWLPPAWRSETCWARRSRFGDGRLKLLVCEVFLEGWPPAS